MSDSFYLKVIGTVKLKEDIRGRARDEHYQNQFRDKHSSLAYLLGKVYCPTSYHHYSDILRYRSHILIEFQLKILPRCSKLAFWCWLEGANSQTIWERKRFTSSTKNNYHCHRCTCSYNRWLTIFHMFVFFFQHIVGICMLYMFSRYPYLIIPFFG